jgi:hypothetical protein
VVFISIESVKSIAYTNIITASLPTLYNVLGEQIAIYSY